MNVTTTTTQKEEQAMSKVWVTDGIYGETAEVPEGADMDAFALDWLANYEVPGPIDSTVWVRSEIWWYDEEDERERLIGSAVRAVDPDEPDCICTAIRHDWRSWLALVGGDRRNPGVFAHGGGVEIHEVCRQCGIERITDTWATDPQTGEQGLRSVSYVQR